MSFIIEVVSIQDIPSAALLESKLHLTNPVRTDVVVQLYLVAYDRNIGILRRVGDIVSTPKKNDCQSYVVFNTFRDLGFIPSNDSFLKVDVFHQNCDAPNLLGHAEIPIETINSTRKYYSICNSENICNAKKSTFSICLRRVYSEERPPLIKTFFLIRHGESKWNEAQSKINISGMVLDRDHALTEDGIMQATELNAKWRGVDEIISFETSDSEDAKLNSAEGLTIKNDSSELLLDLEFEENTHQKVPQEANYMESIWKKNDLFVPSTANTTVDSSSDDLYFSFAKNNNPGELEDDFELDKSNSKTEGRNKTISVAVLEVLQRQESFKAQFFKVDRVFCSPLTRAIETAYVALEGHPALMRYGITLCSNIREVKRIGGMDTVGIETTKAGILSRVQSELAAVVGLPRAVELLTSSAPFDASEAEQQQWWTPLASYETDKDVQDRVRDFLCFVRYCEAERPLFVGHSLFFKAFYSKRVSESSFIRPKEKSNSTNANNNTTDNNNNNNEKDEEILKRLELLTNLRKHRLTNASLLAVTVAFCSSDRHDGTCEADIIDAEVLFGGGFTHQEAASNPAQPTLSSTLGGMVEAIDTSIVSVRYASSKQHAQQLLNKVQSNLQTDFDVGKKVISDSVKKFSGKVFDLFEK